MRFTAALGVKETDDDEGEKEHQAGDDDAHGQVQLVPLDVDMCEGQTDVGPAVVAGDEGVVDPEGVEPGGAVDPRGVAAAPDVDEEPGGESEVGGLQGGVLHLHLVTLVDILQL